MKKLSYWIDRASDKSEREELIRKYKQLQRESRSLPAHPADHKKFTFVWYADDWLAGVCGTKEECETLKAEISQFLSTELKLTLSEEKIEHFMFAKGIIQQKPNGTLQFRSTRTVQLL